MRVSSFAPVGAKSATLLILGSMPGLASLRAGQYYAHPRNQFWPILGEIVGFDPGRPYAERIAGLSSSGIALWDVLESCTRAGSLDADIESGSVVANDFVAFFASHPRIGKVVFNGATAERWYRRHVAPALPPRPMVYARLPSTSPAHAGLSCRQKLEAWRLEIRGDAAQAGLQPAGRRRRDKGKRL